MSFSVEKYKKDIDALVNKGNMLEYAMSFEYNPDQLKKICKTDKEIENIMNKLPDFREEYQAWYSETKVLIKQLLPDRLDDFVRYYEKPKSRKVIDSDSYRIEDYLQGLHVTSGIGKVVVDTSAAIPCFKQQLAIIKALQKRFESSLYDIRLHLQAEMFDDELDAASYLLKNKFMRAAGAMAGVVLERHLKQMCIDHKVALGAKKNPTINDLNDALRNANFIETTDCIRIKVLSDIRNKCSHNKKVEPTEADVTELIEGVKKVIKTLF